MVIPTRNESANVGELLARLGRLPEGVLGEVLFVDDSDDDTPVVIDRYAADCGFPVNVVHRGPGNRDGGLSGAVIEGFRRATGEWVCVMDGDLQHPPEIVGTLFETGRTEQADLVFATRHATGGGRDGLGPFRSLASRAATLAARLAFPRRLAAVSDPMSGFFLVRRARLDVDALRPDGFKILLEVIVRTPGLCATEVGYEFGFRFAGESKASPGEAVRYLRHLARLRLAMGTRWAATVAAMTRFGLVGLAGIFVNQALLWLAVEQGGLGYLLGAVLATQASTTTNFLMTERWVFRSAHEGGRGRRYLAFSAVNNGALLLRVPLLAVLVSHAGLHYLTANLVSLVALFAVRFAVSDRLIWRRSDSGAATAMRHRYDIGGLLTVASEIKLPELEWFRSEFVGEADIELRRGLVGGLLPNARAAVDVAEGQVLYQEHLGALGTNFAVDMSGPIRVTVSPLLAASPHVVYTNVVEALLRFVLVSRGSMLLHSATFVLDGQTVMLSAKTDTGKTGTILRILRERGAVFLSDDMTIVGPDGSVHSYPKPLTISAHTLRAVDTGALSRWERTKLAVQSRIHSKSGREMAIRLAAMNLPIMALNAVMQIIVPPPKYMIDRLVPCTIGRSGQARNLFIIERGTPALSEVSFDDALDELIDNTDDAYGFPPFSQFAPAIALDGDGYLTLRAKERGILASALQGIRVRRVASDSFTWADTIPQLVAADTDVPAERTAAEAR